MSMFDSSLKKYYAYFHPTYEGGTTNSMLEIIPGGKYDNFIFAPFDCKVTSSSGSGTYYFEDGNKWISFSASSGAGITTGDYKKGDFIGILVGYITLISWDDGMLERIASTTGWVNNDTPAGGGKCIVQQMALNDGTGYYGKVHTEILTPGTEYMPVQPTSETGQRFIGWSTTWPTYTPYSGVIPDSPYFYLYGIWEATDSIYENTDIFDIKSGQVDIVKNQHNHRQTVKHPKGTYCPPFCISDVYDAGPYFINLGTTGHGGVVPSIYFYSDLVLVPNPDSIDIEKYFFGKIKILTDIVHDKYITTTEKTENPYPEATDLLYGHNASDFKLGWIHSIDDDYKNYYGAYWYASGHYGGKKDNSFIPLMYAYLLTKK